MKPMTMIFRVRRPARESGAADTLHELEWLGGEALVAPLPIAPRILPRVMQEQRCDDAAIDWIAF